jgi:hypothetical protein
VRRKISFFVTATAGLAAVVWATRPPAIPSFQGTSLETWIEQYSASDLENPDSVDTQRAREAISSIGTNAIPILLKWIAYEEPPWYGRATAVTDKLPLHDRFYFMLSKPGFRVQEAVHAFKALRTCGSNAVPTFIRFLTNDSKPHIAMRASEALAYVGKPAMPEILRTLTNGLSPNRDLAAHAIADMDTTLLGDEGNAAVPILVSLLDNSDTELAETAALALGELRLQPAKVVPALLVMLTNPEPELRTRAAFSLGAFANGAASAIPALLATQNDTHSEVRLAAQFALFYIDPSSFPEPKHEYGF